MIHRRDQLSASKVLADRVLEHKTITVKWNTTVESFHGNSEELTHVTTRSKNTGGQEKLKTSGAFVAIGHDPGSGFLKDALERDDRGYIVVHKGTATSVPGVFAAGDIADPVYRQAATASGTGVMAALDAERFLNEQ